MARSFRAFTRLSPAEAVAALAHDIRQQTEFPPGSTDPVTRNQIVDGEVSESHVSLRVRDDIANSFSARFSGRFVATRDGAMLEGQFHHATVVRIQLALFRILAALFGISMSGFILYGVIRSSTPWGLGLIASILFPLAFAGLMLWLSACISRLKPERLEKFIRTSIGDHLAS